MPAIQPTSKPRRERPIAVRGRIGNWAAFLLRVARQENAGGIIAPTHKAVQDLEVR